MSPNPETVTRGSADTRSLLIRTAVDLFAVRGVDGVSLREIGVAAGQANNAVLHYYFGNLDGLLRAIVEDFSREIDMATAVADHLPPGRRATVHDLAEALVLPLAQLLDSEPAYLQFIARVMSDPARAALLVEEPASQWFRTVAKRVKADLGPAVLRHRFAFAVTLTVHSLADRAYAETRRQAPEPRPRFVDELSDAVAAVLGEASRSRRAPK
jgi:AcrR family transcriptional regulator